MGEINDQGTKDEPYYDFRAERVPLLVLGSHLLPRSNPFARAASLSFFALVQVLLLSTLALSLITAVVARDQKAAMGQSLFTAGTVVCSFVYILENQLQEGNLSTAAERLRTGFHSYDDGLTEDYVEIKERRLSQARSIISALTMVYMNSVWLYVVFFPVFKYFVLNVDAPSEGSGINEYLPLQIYFPFDTRTPLGYSVAFSFNGFTLLFMYSSFSAYTQIFTSCVLQLTAEYEILNFSIENIERRALYTLKMMYSDMQKDLNNVYQDSEFQNKMSQCLRENIRHHQAILQFKKNISPYLEIAAATAVLSVSGLMAAAIVIVLQDPMRYIMLAVTSLATVLTYYPACHIGQLATNVSSNTPNRLYGTPWPHCSQKFKVNLKIFIQNAFKPCVFRAPGLKVNVSLETFAEVMSGGYKLINLLR